jgi:hypothetical protein
MLFQRNISLLLGRMETHRRVEFTGIELTGGADLAALVEKATAGLHTARVERELCVGVTPSVLPRKTTH